MYCWSCGSPIDGSARACSRCGTATVATLRSGGSSPPAESSARHRAPTQLRSCPSCGFRGEGIPYFKRAGNLALLTLASLFTYLVGGAVYWLIKRGDRVCPSCGLNWDRSRPLGGENFADSASPVPAGAPASNGSREGLSARGSGDELPAPLRERDLPHGGLLRRISGVVLGLSSLLLIGIAIMEGIAGPAVAGGILGLTGALTYGWGWKALHRRREALMQRLQRRVLRLARMRRGRLTATEVAAELDLTLPSAERVLLSLDDGFRVRSDVSEEGILYFEFPEVRLLPGGDDSMARGP